MSDGPIPQTTARSSTVIAVANELDTAARQLAVYIDSLTGLTPEQRCELRGLPMAMIRWKDALDPARAPRLEAEERCLPASVGAP